MSLDTALGAPQPGRMFVVALALVSAGLWLHARRRHTLRAGHTALTLGTTGAPLAG